MKTGKSLVEMAKTLEDIKTNARDFLVPVEKMQMEVVPDGVHGEANIITFPTGAGQEKRGVVPNGWASRQIAGYCQIPGAYYDRIQRENPKLLADAVNHGIAMEATVEAERDGKVESRMVRTYKGEMRAFLSSRYRRLDSYDLLETVLPILIDNKFEVHSAELTERRTYIKALTTKVQAEIKKGDVVQYGLVISSSDVGAGTLRVEPLLYRLVCQNGLISAHALKKFHLGKDLADTDVYELLQDKTKQLTDAAFWAQVRDITLASMKEVNFEQEVNRLRIAADMPIKNFNIPEVVELANKAVGAGAGIESQRSIVGYLANGADGAGLTQWGLINGFTFAAQQKDVDYDTSVELERAASKILDLTPSQWRKVSEG